MDLRQKQYSICRTPRYGMRREKISLRECKTLFEIKRVYIFVINFSINYSYLEYDIKKQVDLIIYKVKKINQI